MRVSGQIKEASLEQLVADPTNTPEGRIWENTTSKDLKVILNNIVRKVFTSADQIASANIADGSIISSKIPDGSITQAKRAPLGRQLSASSGNFQTASTSPVDVTNLSVSITTTGRPVFVGLVSDGGGSASSIGAISMPNVNAVEAFFGIKRGSTEVAKYTASKSYYGTTSSMDINVPSSSLYTIDDAPAGTHTYKVTAAAFGVSNATVKNAKLVAFEL